MNPEQKASVANQQPDGVRSSGLILHSMFPENNTSETLRVSVRACPY